MTIARARWSSSSSFPSFWAVWPVLLLFVLLSTLFNAIVPLGEGPDEPGHLAYVLFLVNEKRLPVVSPAAPGTDHRSDDVPGEGHQPPLAYLLATPAVFWLPRDQRVIVQTSNPNFLWRGGSDGAAFIRASQEYWPWRGITLAWHLARGSSCLAGVVLLCGVWGTARALRSTYAQWFAPHSQRMIPFLATILVACNPQLLFTSALVNNDNWLAAWSALLLWLCCTLTRTAPLGWVLKHAVGVGGILGLALLTKQSAILLIPLVLVTSWRVGQTKGVFHLATWGGVALAMSGWWYLRNWYLYGDPMGLELFRATFSSGPFLWREPTMWFTAMQKLHHSFWARFGWLTVVPPSWVIWSFCGLEVVALLGWITIVLRRRKSHASQLRTTSHTSSSSRLVDLLSSRSFPLLLVMLLPLLTFTWVIAFAWVAGPVAWQGRFLFPALAAIASMLAIGLVAWVPDTASSDTISSPRRAITMWLVSEQGGNVMVFTLASMMASLALYLLIGVIKPAYRWETLPQDQALRQLGHAIVARFARDWERGILLRGWHGSGTRPVTQTSDIVSGSTITVTLTWHALQRLPEDWVVFVHLLGPAEPTARARSAVILAEHNSRPRLGQFPFPLWTPGDWVVDPHPLVLSRDLPAGPYRLGVGLWKFPFRGKRMPVWSVDDVAAGNMVVIPVVLQAMGHELQVVPAEDYPQGHGGGWGAYESFVGP